MACHLSDDNKSVTNCPSVKQIVKTLGFYQQLTKETNSHAINDQITEHFSKHPTIINDYHHILLQHLLSDNKYQDNENFNVIHNMLSESITCDIAKCIKYQRNQRGRYKQINGDQYGEEKLMNETFNLIKQDSRCSFYKEFLDSMHCYFIHAYDIGRRVQHSPENDDEIQDNEEIDVLYDTKTLTFEDKQMKQLTEDKKPATDSTQKFNKFATEITDDTLQKETQDTDNEPLLDGLIERMQSEKIPLSIIEAFYDKLMSEEFDSDALTDEIENDIINITNALVKKNYDYVVVDYVKNKEFASNTALYSFGIRYYYWDQNKHHYWYVNKKYNDFKQEMLDVKKGIAKDVWDELLKKADVMMTESEIVRKLKSSGKDYAYGIKNGLPIQREHIMAICYYTDTTEASYEFSKSFRKVETDKSDDDTKKRNMEYREWSRLLREAVECFGTKMEEAKLRVFYHGVSMIYFVSFIAKFCGPTSTTSSMQIATRFTSDNGIILELEKAPTGGKLKYFNVSYLSRYNEEERLFIGGEYVLQFKSIRNIFTKENYEKIMMPLSIFDKMINAEKLSKQNIEKKRFKVMFENINELIKHEIEEEKNNLPEYINICFKALVKNRKMIKFNIDYIKECYPLFMKIFMNKEYSRYFINDLDNNLLAFDFIANIFQQCEEIHSIRTDPKQNVFTGQGLMYLDSLIPILNKINKNYFTSHIPIISFNINGLYGINSHQINKNKLNINIKIPFGHFGYLYFKLKNKQCVIIENKLNHSVITSQWKVDDIEYEQSFMLQYDAKINDKGSLIIGSGNYQWTILCNNI
eukprot:544109_1